MENGKLSRGFWHLYNAIVCSNLADGISLMTLPIIARSLTTNPLNLSMVSALRELPLLIFILIAGTIVDQVDKRQLAIKLNLVRFGILMVTLMLYTLNAMSIPVLLVVCFLIGTVEVFVDLCPPSMIPTIVPSNKLVDANGKIYAVESLSNYLTGRLLGGFLGAFSALSLGIIAIFYAASSFFYMKIETKTEVRKKIQIPSLIPQIKDGIKLVFSNKNLSLLSILGFIGNLAIGAVFATHIIYVTIYLKLPDWVFASSFASFALGNIIAGLFVNRLIADIGPKASLLISIGSIAMMFISNSFLKFPNYIIGSFFIGGMAANIWNTISLSYRQCITPQSSLGSVNAVFRLLSFGGQPIGSILGGVVTSYFGIEFVWPSFGIFFLSNIIICLLLKNFTMIHKHEA